MYVLEWGSLGSGDGQFKAAVHVAAPPSGFVYVSDQVLDRVQKFDDEGTYLAKWGGTGTAEKQFNNAWGLGVDSSGNLYVADSSNHRIQKFDSAGTFLLTWGYGVDTGADSFETCTSACQAGIPGPNPGQLSSPLGLAVDSTDKVLVAAYSSRKVAKYASNGSYLTQWGSPGTAEGQFTGGPHAIAVDSDGFVYTSEAIPGNARVQMFDKNGNFKRMWGYGVEDGSSEFQVCTSGCQAGLTGSGEWQFDGPVGMTVDSDNHVYVADSSNNRVYKFDRRGTRLTKWNDGNGVLDGPFGLAIDGPALYLADFRNDRIIKYVGPYFETFVGEPEMERRP